MKFSIDKAQPDDALALLEYFRQVGGESGNLTFGPEGLPFDEASERSYIQSVLDSEKDLILLAKDEEGRIAGDISLTAFPRRLSHRSDLGITVLREYWGLGLGSCLMEEAIMFAREKGIEVLYLEVRSTNKTAIHLYEKYGFHRIGHMERFMKIGDQYYSAEMMALYL